MPDPSVSMRRLLTALIVSLSLACLGEGVTGSSSVTGSYTLRTINGAPLPYTISGSGTTSTEIIRDVITLYQGNTYARSRDSRTTVNGQTTNESTAETGSYGLFGTSITFQNGVTGESTLGNINGNTMTIVKSGMTSVYTK